MVTQIKRFFLGTVILVLLVGGSALATRPAAGSILSHARPVTGGCPGILGPCLPHRA